MHLVGLYLVCDHAHLFVNIVLPHVFGERCELAFDVLGMLAPQRRSSKLLRSRPVTGGAGWNPALRVAGKDQADRGIALPQTAPTLWDTLTSHRRQPTGTMGDIGCDNGRVLIAQGVRDRVHDPP